MFLVADALGAVFPLTHSGPQLLWSCVPQQGPALSGQVGDPGWNLKPNRR